MSFSKLEEAVDYFGFIGLETRADIKSKYLSLAKSMHPDAGGSSEEFQRLNYYYDVIEEYLDNFVYRFDKEEYVKHMSNTAEYKI